MNIPLKYQKSSEIDNQTISKLKNLTNRYSLALKKFSKSPLSSQNFNEQVKKWFFSLSIQKRLSISSIENKWTSIVLHQLYNHQKSKKNLRFIPRINENAVPFMDKLFSDPKTRAKCLVQQDISHFLNYYAMASENYETNPKFNSLTWNFLDEIVFYYPNNEKCDLNETNQKNTFPFFTLSPKIIDKVEAFDLFFGILSNDKSFEGPIQLTNTGSIDIPEWSKQPEGSNYCFNVLEIFCAYFEQVISVRYILSLFDKEDLFANTIISNYLVVRTQLLEFLKNKNVNNYFEYLNVEKIIKEIFYSSNIEKFIEKKKYGLILPTDEKCLWNENAVLNKIISVFKDFFASVTLEENELNLLDKTLFFKIGQIFTYDDFVFRKVYEVLYGFYSISQTEDIMKEIEDLCLNTNNTSKKRKRKKKQKDKTVEYDYSILESPSTGPQSEVSAPSVKPQYSFIKAKSDNNCNKYNISKNNNNILSENSNYIINNFMGNLMFIKLGHKKESTSSLNNISSDHSESVSVVAPIISEIINLSLSRAIEGTSLFNLSFHSTISGSLPKNNNYHTKKQRKKEKGFFLYSTTKKKKDNTQHQHPHKSFMAKLNEDILTYNQNVSEILSELRPLKELIVSIIQLHLAQVLENLCYYEIEIYGSYESGLDIESSDIDLLFKLEKQKKLSTSQIMMVITNFFIALNRYERVNPIYTATIPLIKLAIIPEAFLDPIEHEEMLKRYQNFKNSASYSNYPYDKSELDIINVDISFPNQNKKNTSRLQVEYIKHFVTKSVEIKPTVKILKRLLKVTFLNNSYKGGLSSYTLFLLTTAFHKFNENKKNPNNNTYAHFFNELMKFYSNFDFMSVMVNVAEDMPYMEYDISIAEGVPIIIDPVTSLNAGKSSFNIGEVVNMFGGVVKIVNDIKTNYDKGLYNNNSNVNFIDELMKEIVK